MKPNPFLRPRARDGAPSGVIVPDNARNAVLDLLATGHKTAEDIAACRPFSVSLVKRNLKRLQDKGVVRIVGYQNWQTKSGVRRRRVWGLA